MDQFAEASFDIVKLQSCWTFFFMQWITMKLRWNDCYLIDFDTEKLLHNVGNIEPYKKSIMLDSMCFFLSLVSCQGKFVKVYWTHNKWLRSVMKLFSETIWRRIFCWKPIGKTCECFVCEGTYASWKRWKMVERAMTALTLMSYLWVL